MRRPGASLPPSQIVTFKPSISEDNTPLEIGDHMRTRFIALFFLCFGLTSFTHAEQPWFEGKLVLTSSAATDSYRTYKVALVMGDRAALLFNYAGNFNAEPNDRSAGGCPACVVAQRLLSTLLHDCQATQADFCSHQMPIHYRVETCGNGRAQCLAIDFPKDPSKGLEGKHKTLWLVADIRSAADVAADNRQACLGSEFHVCGQ